MWAVERIVKEDQEDRRLRVDDHHGGTLPPSTTQRRVISSRQRYGLQVEGRENVHRPVQVKLKSEWRPVVEQIQMRGPGGPGLKTASMEACMMHRSLDFNLQGCRA